jgi:lipopolysaccharide transport system permease protein
VLTVVRPGSTWRLNLRELWLYRDLWWVLGVRELRLRYRQTAIGVAWVVLQPLLAAAVLAFVFGRVAGLPSEGIPYFPFVFAGYVGWTAFSQTVSRVSPVLVWNVNLITKIFFPRLIMPLSYALSVMLDLVIMALLMIPILVAYDLPVRPQAALVPVWGLFILMLGLGLGVAASALMVRYRDIHNVIPVVLQLLLFASPVAFSASAVPADAKLAVTINPLTGLLEALRWSLLGTDVDWLQVGAGCAVAVLVFLTGVIWFRHIERGFADVI